LRHGAEAVAQDGKAAREIVEQTVDLTVQGGEGVLGARHLALAPDRNQRFQIHGRSPFLNLSRPFSGATRIQYSSGRYVPCARSKVPAGAALPISAGRRAFRTLDDGSR